MRLKELGEFELIDLIKKTLESKVIGDDTAPVEYCSKKLLLTTDVLNEGVHFLRSYIPEAVGWKAISVNVSDVIANGGLPKWALISLNLPEDLEVSYVERFYIGVKRACEFYKCEVVGGNISKSEKIGISVFLVGETERFVGRDGARLGDSVFVSGTLGDSRAGLELLLMEKEEYEPFELALIQRHLRPTARIDYVKHIQKYANASMDISDGLVADANHLAQRSGVKIEILSEKLPLSNELKMYCEKYGKNPIEYALFGGEDYQLLFTHPKERWNPFLDMTEIGRVEEGEGVFVDGKKVEPKGWKHF